MPTTPFPKLAEVPLHLSSIIFDDQSPSDPPDYMKILSDLDSLEGTWIIFASLVRKCSTMNLGTIIGCSKHYLVCFLQDVNHTVVEVVEVSSSIK
jgi:hypothetical protein